MLFVKYFFVIIPIKLMFFIYSPHQIDYRRVAQKMKKDEKNNPHSLAVFR